jgi:transposase
MRALSLDLRNRVLTFVAQGASHRVAGARFGVSSASVSRWRRLMQDQGDAGSRASGGDRRSHKIEAYCEEILVLNAARPDATMEELRCALADRGLVFGEGALRGFFKRHRITRKKRPDMPANRSARMSGKSGRSGARDNPVWRQDA